MGRCAEPVEPDPLAGTHAGHAQCAKTDDAGTQQRGGMAVVERCQLVHEVGPDDRIFGVSAVDVVTGKDRRIA